jgi:hypothetical protein
MERATGVPVKIFLPVTACSCPSPAGAALDSPLRSVKVLQAGEVRSSRLAFLDWESRRGQQRACET